MIPCQSNQLEIQENSAEFCRGIKSMFCSSTICDVYVFVFLYVYLAHM